MEFDESVMQRGRLISSKEAQSLSRPFTASDVVEALKSIDANKAPGPDGFSTGFFRDNWDIVHGDVKGAIINFFNSSKLLGQINATSITLVPKVQCPKNVGDFRPISSCNTTYKLISKMLAQRLSEVLPNIITPSQTSFVKGKSIMTNILLSQHLVRNYHRMIEKPQCLMKIDLTKAYDSVSCKFILDVLRALRFPEAFIKWIQLKPSRSKLFCCRYKCTGVALSCYHQGFRRRLMGCVGILSGRVTLMIM